jgi:hypothetical protein
MKMALVSQQGNSDGAAYLIVSSGQGREHRIWMGPDSTASPASGYYVCPAGVGLCKEKTGAQLVEQYTIPKNHEFDVDVAVTADNQARLAIAGVSSTVAPAETTPLSSFQLYLFSDAGKNFHVTIDDIRFTYA